MRLTQSLPLRINLISLVFAALVASVLTGLGGLFLHHQQTENAVNRAKLAADELAMRAGRLLALELRLSDFMGFDEQCRAVVHNSPMLAEAAVFDTDHRGAFASRSPAPAWPSGTAAANADGLLVVATPSGPAVWRPLLRDGGEPHGYVMVRVDGQAVLSATLSRVGWLVASALGLFVLVLGVQQWVFWRAVGRPLSDLVQLADSIRPERPETLLARPANGRSVGDDDIGRLHRAFDRLTHRLLDAQRQLIAHNEQLEATVLERTHQLEQANTLLARDIERRQQLENELRTLASTDALTGLANRAFILPYAERRIEQKRRDGQPFGLMLFDFDGFKAINDHHGHAAGDEVLRVMGRRIQQVCRSADVVARLGGDEFLLAFEGFQDDAQVHVLGERLLRLFDDPIRVGSLQLKVGVSIGAAVYPADAPDLEALVAGADAAMYAVKQDGGGFRRAMPGPKESSGTGEPPVGAAPRDTSASPA